MIIKLYTNIRRVSEMVVAVRDSDVIKLMDMNGKLFKYLVPSEMSNVTKGFKEKSKEIIEVFN